MGRLAEELQIRLRDRLAEARPELDWAIEGRVGGTAVDVLGTGSGRLVAVELEWRRADPVNNTAKLFRHLAEEDVAADRVDVVQVFTAHYDLVSGGVSTRRANAEFVGRSAADGLDALEYHAVDLRIEPPMNGDSFDARWEDALAGTVNRVTSVL